MRAGAMTSWTIEHGLAGLRSGDKGFYYDKEHGMADFSWDDDADRYEDYLHQMEAILAEVQASMREALDEAQAKIRDTADDIFVHLRGLDERITYLESRFSNA